jgi:hypothetical protein
MLMNAPPRDVDTFTDAVFAAEGMEPGLHSNYAALCVTRSSDG